MSNFQQPMEEGDLFVSLPHRCQHHAPEPSANRRPRWYVASSTDSTRSVLHRQRLGADRRSDNNDCWAGPFACLRTCRYCPTGLLNNYGPEPEIFQPGETVEIILDSLTLQDLNNFWGVSKASPQLSVGYIARMLASSRLALSEFAEVQTREFVTGDALT